MPTLIVLILTLVTLIWYTVETGRLRKIAQQQIRIALDQQRMSVQPVVTLEFDRKPHKLEYGMPKLCNIGIGPAFNIKIRSIGSSEAEIRFEPVALLKPSAERVTEASVYLKGRYDQRLRDGDAFARQLETLSTAQVDLTTVEPTSRASIFELLTEYDDSIGNHYVSEMRLLHDVLLEETSTRFNANPRSRPGLRGEFSTSMRRSFPVATGCRVLGWSGGRRKAGIVTTLTLVASVGQPKRCGTTTPHGLV